MLNDDSIPGGIYLQVCLPVAERYLVQTELIWTLQITVGTLSIDSLSSSPVTSIREISLCLLPILVYVLCQSIVDPGHLPITNERICSGIYNNK